MFQISTSREADVRSGSRNQAVCQFLLVRDACMFYSMALKVLYVVFTAYVLRAFLLPYLLSNVLLR